MIEGVGNQLRYFLGESCGGCKLSPIFGLPAMPEQELLTDYRK